MARYHTAGQALAASLSDDDLELVQKYAEVQVAARASGRLVCPLGQNPTPTPLFPPLSAISPA